MKIIKTEKGKTLEALIYPLLLVAILWSVFLIDRVYHLNLYKYGIKPQTIEGLKGIFFMPFIHGQKDYSHLINNSIPIFILLGTLIYFYREIALKIILLIWFLGGLLLWFFAFRSQSFHIGISGVIYGLFGFLLVSGFIRRYLPLQAISFFVAFVYGSMIWGILPTEERISWEGHLSGFLIGILLAVAFRKMGPVLPKYNYEIEQELGIEPPDFEKEWNERRRIWLEQNQPKISENTPEKQEEIPKKKEDEKQENSSFSSSINNISINYHFIPKKEGKKDVNL